MFEVFAIMMVLWINGRFVRGSTNAGNSVSTSVISLPRSPQPIYTTICVSAHFASVCSETVFPVPNPPGIMACLLYTSDAADEEDSVDLGGRRIIKKKKKKKKKKEE